MTNLYSETGQMAATAPFDFDKTLAFLGQFEPMKDEQAISGQSLAKAIQVLGQPILFHLTSTGTLEDPRLEYHLETEQPIAGNIQAAALDRIAFSLSLDDDLRPFYEISRSDVSFEPVVRRLYGLHQVKFSSPFEAACWGVLSQRTPIPVARKLKEELVRKFGGLLTIKGRPYPVFPEPGQLVSVPDYELNTVLKNEQKAGYLAAVVAAFNQLGEPFLHKGDYDQVRQALLQIKGVGEWTADLILLRGLGRMEKINLSPGSLFEKRLAEAVARVYGRRQGVSADEILTLARKYGDWQGYWAYYLRTDV